MHREIRMAGLKLTESHVREFQLGIMSVAYMFFFFNDPATPEIYTLPLRAALPISWIFFPRSATRAAPCGKRRCCSAISTLRSEEHTSELQSLRHLVCRLLLEK